MAQHSQDAERSPEVNIEENVIHPQEQKDQQRQRQIWPT